MFILQKRFSFKKDLVNYVQKMCWLGYNEELLALLKHASLLQEPSVAFSINILL
jgi:hypothetical protein